MLEQFYAYNNTCWKGR